MGEPNFEYPLSDSRRAVNAASFLMFGSPALLISAGLMVESVGEHKAWPIFSRERIGGIAGTIVMHKVRTLPKIQTAQGAQGGAYHPDASPVAIGMRDRRFDELLQILQVGLGQLHFPGTRPVDPLNMDALKDAAPSDGFFDEWEMGLYFNSGVVSDGEIHLKPYPNHMEPNLLRTRMALEIMGFRNASFREDIKIAKKAAKVMLGREVDLKDELKQANWLLEHDLMNVPPQPGSTNLTLLQPDSFEGASVPYAA